VHHFERHRFVQRQVLRHEHRAHGSRSERAHDAVAPIDDATLPATR
jgi:hypothetical protein